MVLVSREREQRVDRTKAARLRSAAVRSTYKVVKVVAGRDHVVHDFAYGHFLLAHVAQVEGADGVGAVAQREQRRACRKQQVQFTGSRSGFAVASQHHS